VGGRRVERRVEVLEMRIAGVKGHAACVGPARAKRRACRLCYAECPPRAVWRVEGREARHGSRAPRDSRRLRDILRNPDPPPPLPPTRVGARLVFLVACQLVGRTQIARDFGFGVDGVARRFRGL